MNTNQSPESLLIQIIETDLSNNTKSSELCKFYATYNPNFQIGQFIHFSSKKYGEPLSVSFVNTESNHTHKVEKLEWIFIEEAASGNMMVVSLMVFVSKKDVKANKETNLYPPAIYLK